MKVLKEIRSWIFSFCIALVLALGISIFIFQPYRVEGHSMDPTLHDRERIYVSKLTHTLSSYPKYGDIVIIDSHVNEKRSFKDDFLDSPLFHLFSQQTDERFFVKRVIGKSGDTIEVRNSKVYRNGQALDEPYLNEQMAAAADQKWTVPEGDVFVMGDNRNHSRDSREIGFVPLDHVLGKKGF